MKKLLVSIFSVLMLSGCVSTYSDSDLVIRNDHGGEAEIYKELVKTLKGKRVVIDGTCHSACMYYISSYSTANGYCATERADLGFHAPFFAKRGDLNNIQYGVYQGVDLAVLSEKNEKIFLESLPSRVRKYIQEKGVPSVYRGDSPDKVTHIRGKDAVRLLGKC